MSKIIIVPDLGGTPARVHRPSGTIFLNGKTFSNYRDFEQKWIILHEKGHFEKQTKSEIEADRYAFEQFAGSEPCSLKKILTTVYSTLNMRNPEHVKRYNEILYQVLKTDRYKFNNLQIDKFLEEMNDQKLEALLVSYLKLKGITDLNSLTDNQKKAVVTDFAASSEVQALIQEGVATEMGVNNYSDLGGIFGSLIDKFAGPAIAKANEITNNVITKAGSAVGINPSKLTGIANIVNPANFLSGGSQQTAINKLNQQNALEEAKLTASQIAEAKSQIGAGVTSPAAQQAAQAAQLQAQSDQNAQALQAAQAAKAEEEKKAKKKKMIIGGAIAGGVIIIAVVLYFVLRKK